ncbi:MAG: DUF3883 domain-containing protein [Pseudomonadota bacterium]|nr:DUF3883 domain-containing protein [Pseudomonadota bacterium]
MSFLTAERRSRLRVLLANLAEGQREYEEIGRLDAQIRIDYHGRFLIELVQNAVDPALKDGVQHARILIVRTPTSLAVLNQGAAFDDAGLASIISLGLSPKKPDEAIGNKGVGFKSVFEVTDAAEVFGIGPGQRTLRSAPGLRMRLSRAPASAQPRLLKEALELVREEPALMAKIAARHEDVDAAIRAALNCSPGWRYPEELASKDWKAKADELGLSAGDLATFQTAIVLRLAPSAMAKVDQAVGEFAQNAQEVHLFLPGVERIELRDAVGSTILERTDVATDARGIVVRRLRSQLPGAAVAESHFWVARGVVRGPELEAAAQRLPGPGWAAVREAEVQVALPVPRAGESLAADGRYYVGLPSRDETGSPFRVDARFHATLSRTKLDRADNPYNLLLDRAATVLAAGLLRALRDSARGAAILFDPERARRAVTLALASSGRQGFAEAVRERLKGESVILLDDGETFGAPGTARQIAGDDGDVIELINATVGPAAFIECGVHLVDADIENHAGKLLTELGVPTLQPKELAARASGASLLERLAGTLPRADVAAWRSLLLWSAKRLAGAGTDQRILPVAGGGFATIEARPFVPLLPTAAAGELTAAEIPMHLLEALPFLDAEILGADEELRRILVEGAQPLARRPAALDIIERAVLPALSAAADAGSDAEAREFLTLALSLLGRVGAGEPIGNLPWRVPCTRGWLPADEAYLGDAWAEDDERDDDDKPGLVEAVYGPEGRCIAPWWGAASDKSRTRAALRRIGVSEEPRMFVYEPILNAFWGDSRRGTPKAVAPEGIPQATWDRWLGQIAQTASVDWGPQTWWRLEGVAWIDGLERPETVIALASWALTRKPETATLLPATWRKTEQHVEQLWVHALRRLTEPFIPSHPSCTLAGRPALPAELCRLASSDRNVVAWLPRVAEKLNAELLGLLGVRTLAEMPAVWLVDQLSAFAEGLGADRKNGILARGMWSLLNGRPRPEALPDLTGRLLPLWRDGAVVGVAGSEVSRLYVVDDAYAAAVLGDALDGALLLEPEAENWTSLSDRLRASLPNAVIELVSRLPVPYAVDPATKVEALFALLARTVGERAVAIIAALLRTQRTGVGDKDIQRAWNALSSAKVQIGVLPETAPRAVWLRDKATLVCQQVDGGELVAELWPVVGKVWKNELLSLGNALGRGARSLQDFLRHENIREEAIEDAAARFNFGAIFPSYGSNGGATIPAAPLSSNVGAVRRPGEFGVGSGEAVIDVDELPRIDLDAAQIRVRRAATPQQLPGPSAAPAGRPSAPGEGRVRSRPQSSSSDDYAREIGHLGEVFAFRALAATLPGFDETCWKSSSRGFLGFAGGDDTLGYDFRYVDTAGALCGRAGAECLIEVKANAGRMKERFSVSRNEWNLAVECHGSTTRMFVIVRVEGIATVPAVAAVIADPVQFVEEGGLLLSPKDGWWVDLGSGAGSYQGVEGGGLTKPFARDAPHTVDLEMD